ncbi:MAG: hypothetical protein ACLTMR_01985 [Faecalibacillus sp.]
MIVQLFKFNAWIEWLYIMFRNHFPDLNGNDYVVVPYEANIENPNSSEIVWISRKHTILSDIGKVYVKTMENFL